MDDPYTLLADALASRSIRTYFQTEGQVVVSYQADPAWPNRGNSFWVTHTGGCWYVCTWVPVRYRVPATADIVEVCADFVARGTQVQPVIPEDLVLKHGLTRLREQ